MNQNDLNQNVTSSAVQAYLDKHFYTLKQLSAHTQIPESRIQDFIASGCVPKHSYQVTASLELETEIFGTSKLPAQTQHYFALSNINACKKAQNLSQTMSLEEARVRIKQDFYTEFRSALKQVSHGRGAWSCCFQGSDFDETGLARVLKQQWEYVQSGAYGICLKEVNALNIVRKQVALCQIDLLTDHERKSALALPDEDRVLLQQAIEIYEQITNDFAPHERPLSSQAKVRRILEHYQLSLNQPALSNQKVA